MQVPHLSAPRPSSVSGEAERAGRGAEAADRCDSSIEGGVSEGEKEEEEEEDPKQVGGQDGESVGVLHGGADGWESHVVTEGVAEHRADQVTWNDIQAHIRVVTPLKL